MCLVRISGNSTELLSASSQKAMLLKSPEQLKPIPDPRTTCQARASSGSATYCDDKMNSAISAKDALLSAEMCFAQDDLISSCNPLMKKSLISALTRTQSLGGKVRWFSLSTKSNESRRRCGISARAPFKQFEIYLMPGLKGDFVEEWMALYATFPGGLCVFKVTCNR